jgi:hypothetical protein
MIIACDESGYEGEKLIGGVTDVFAHGSVRLNADTAEDCIRELRDRIRSPATEYKANHVLREKHRPVLIWLLGPLGPLYGSARVYLVDKAEFVVRRLLEALSDATDPEMFYREGRTAFDPGDWQAFLLAANDLMRTKDHDAPVDCFFAAAERLVRTPSGADRVLKGFERSRAEALRVRLRDDPAMVPPMDPLVPAIVHAVERWGGGDPVTVVHDRQTTLSPSRIRQIGGMCRLDGLELVTARTDPRVQMADFLAGVARKIVSENLNGRGDEELMALVEPYADPSVPGST